MNAPRPIRTVYLYLFSLLGLVLVVIGMVGMVDLGLKATIFTSAEAERRWMERMPPVPPVAHEPGGTAAPLDPRQKEALEDWARRYQQWREGSEKVDPVRSQRERDAARNLALLAVGLPLYLFHWRTIRREAS